MCYTILLIALLLGDKLVQDAFHVPDSINSSVTKDEPNYPVGTHNTPIPIFTMKREFVKKTWIIALQYWLRTYFST
jgi:hypothetical protein